MRSVLVLVLADVETYRSGFSSCIHGNPVAMAICKTSSRSFKIWVTVECDKCFPDLPTEGGEGSEESE